MGPVKARHEGASNADISLYAGDMVSHMMAGVKLEGIQWGHQDDRSLQDAAYGERWKELA